MAPDLLLRLLTTPAMAPALSAAQWDLALRQARRAGLMARLALVVQEAGVPVPAQAQRHLAGALTVCKRLQEALAWELARIRAALADTGAPAVLLKGAAYAAAGLPVAAGRLFGDVDLLVPREHLAVVEAALLEHGWAPMKLDPYDQRYYRQWMHEIPPLEHTRRQTVIDVHHNILPRTARHRPDPSLILDLVRPALQAPGFFVPAPVDLVIHCATHLFYEGETDRALRDLLDFDGLLRHFGPEPGFWDTLVPRAQALDLARPLYYGLRYARRVLGTPIPGEVAQAAATAAPAWPVTLAMDWLAQEGFRPKHPSCRGPFTGLAHFILYLRGHWLRMPLRLLLPHLLRKALPRRAPRPVDRAAIL
ncbi:nucleotidyltransferase domain-containing protein [Thiobacter aerophilum]|uniref:Nucleotidyltransferase family protein n=1 Tax=Thiobacter aerophilum TaxID=3121275 RepID=A0ABV0EGL7_9BURK